MTCDDVFDLLTLPAARVDASSRWRLDEHLVCCASCARLAEALSPALALLAEADDDYEVSSSAVWNDASETGSHEFAEIGVGSDRRPRPAALDQGEPAWHAMRLAVAVLIGLTLGGLLYGRSSVQRDGDDVKEIARGAPPMATLPSNQLSALALSSFSLTAACLPQAEQESRSLLTQSTARPAIDMLAQAESHELACCTICHTTNGLAANHRDAIAQVAKSCQLCHTAAGDVRWHADARHVMQ